MAKPTPATIKYKAKLDSYKVGVVTRYNNSGTTSSTTEEQTLNFHAVIQEQHGAQTEITKFPVQTGFEISNHAIRKNRTVSIEGIVTNTPMLHQQVYGSGLNNQRDVFQVLEALVNGAVPCTVITNLGVYYDVVFTQFNTAQKAGMTDAMTFTISGEEIQVSETIAKTNPVPVSITTLSKAQVESKLNSLITRGRLDPGKYIEKYNPRSPNFDFNAITNDLNPLALSLGFSHPKCIAQGFGDVQNIVSQLTDVIDVSEGVVSLGSDFQIPMKLPSGESSLLTYVVKGYDDITGLHTYTQEILEDAVRVVTGESATAPTGTGLLSNISSQIKGGITGVSGCMIDKTGDFIKSEAEEILSTSLGELRRGANGLVKDIVKAGGGSPFMAGLMDCIAEETSNTYGSGNSTTTEELVNEMITGLGKVGKRTINDVIPKKDTVLTFISSKLELPLGG